MSAPDRRAMVERPGVDLSVRRQCALLNLAERVNDCETAGSLI